MLTRRHILQRAGVGFGALALQSLLARDGLLAEEATGSSLLARPPHFAPKARAAIFLFMYGGPSTLDLFDEKPALAKWHGKAIPVWKDSDAFMGSKTKNVAMASPYRFARHGESGSRSPRHIRSSPGMRTSSASSARCTARVTTTLPRCFR